MEVENRREKLFIIDMLKGGDADNKPEKVTVAPLTRLISLLVIMMIIMIMMIIIMIMMTIL